MCERECVYVRMIGIARFATHTPNSIWIYLRTLNSLGQRFVLDKLFRWLRAGESGMQEIWALIQW